MLRRTSDIVCLFGKYVCSWKTWHNWKLGRRRGRMLGGRGQKQKKSGCLSFLALVTMPYCFMLEKQNPLLLPAIFALTRARRKEVRRWYRTVGSIVISEWSPFRVFFFKTARNKDSRLENTVLFCCHGTVFTGFKVLTKFFGPPGSYRARTL